MEFPKMLPLKEIEMMVSGVKSFFDFLFQSSLALRKVWVYSSKQVITGVNFENYLIRTNEEVDLSSVSVPVCWQLYFPWEIEEKNRSHYWDTKIRFDDFVERGKNLLEEYLGKFIDVVVHRPDKEISDQDLNDFIRYWIQCTHTNPQPLRSALSVHFPTLEYFAQKGGMETKRNVKKWMKFLVKPLEDDGDLKIVFGKDFMESFAEDLAWYRNKRGAHYDTSEDISWSSEDMQQAYNMLRVIMRFHFLNLLQPDHEEFNKKLAKKIWPIVEELKKKKRSLEGDRYA